MTYTQMQSLLETIREEYDWDYAYIGIRTQDEPFALGEMDHCSHIWVDGDDTGDELPGVCATSIDSASVKYHCDDTIGGYCGDHCAIIAGNSVEYGEDADEYIICDPVVIHIVK